MITNVELSGDKWKSAPTGVQLLGKRLVVAEYQASYLKWVKEPGKHGFSLDIFCCIDGKDFTSISLLPIWLLGGVDRDVYDDRTWKKYGLLVLTSGKIIKRGLNEKSILAEISLSGFSCDMQAAASLSLNERRGVFEPVRREGKGRIRL